MGRVERQVAEPGPGGLGLPPHEVDRRVSEQVGRVAPRAVEFAGGLVEVVQLAVVVAVVIDVPGGMADEFVESAFGGPRAGGESDVPLAEATGGVGNRCPLQDLRDQDFALAQSDAVISGDAGQLLGQAMALGDPPGQERGAGNGAGGGSRVEAGQPDTLGGQPVEAGGDHGGVGVVASQVAVTEVVRGDDQDVVRCARGRHHHFDRPATVLDAANGPRYRAGRGQRRPGNTDRIREPAAVPRLEDQLSRVTSDTGQEQHCRGDPFREPQKLFSNDFRFRANNNLQKGALPNSERIEAPRKGPPENPEQPEARGRGESPPQGTRAGFISRPGG